MKINNLLKGFTLVEMLIGVALSTVLMISISIFVTNGIKNVTTQKKVLDNIEQDLDFFTEIQSIMKRVSGSGTIIGSGVLFPINTQYDNGAYAYIGVKSYSGTVCKSTDGNDLKGDEFVTKHVYLKRFFPYEGSRNSNGYSTHVGQHYVTNDSTGDIIIGKEIFGDKLEDGDKGVDVYLNNPTGIASVGNKVFISDTLNNRVLFYNILTKKIYIILDSSDGILMPSGLAYDDTNKILYIANTGKGEILKYTWGKSGTDLNIDFKIPQTINNIKNVQIDFIPGITSITEPNSKTDFSFGGGLSKTTGSNTDYFTGSNNTVKYYFSDFGSSYNQGTKTCSSNYENFSIESGVVVKREITNCNTSTGTEYKKTSNNYPDINTLLDDIEIDLNNIAGIDFSATGSYYVNMKIEGDTSYEEYFPLFTVGDNSILTKDDNALEVLSGELEYPTGISISGSNIVVNNFTDRSKYTVNKNTGTTGLLGTAGSLGIYDYETIDDVHDYLLDVPVEDINITNTDGMLTIVVRYYKKYNCTNSDERVLRTMIFKKNLK